VARAKSPALDGNLQAVHAMAEVGRDGRKAHARLAGSPMRRGLRRHRRQRLRLPRPIAMNIPVWICRPSTHAM